ncbi:MAG TPA: hypothetical protein VHM25_26560 [Polyangiaceae bacterium]|nr:hypothetical protein [Polyangiaceae bacterium]
MQAARAPQPTSEDVDLDCSEDVDLDCFTRSEPPPESRPQRKRAWFTGITGLVLVTLTGALFLARPVSSNGLRALSAASGPAARAPAMLTVAALASPVAATAPQKSSSSSAVDPRAGAQAKLSSRVKGAQKTPPRAKKPLKRGAPSRR